MADISEITLPSGATYDIKDATARHDISILKGSATGAMHYAGVTTTALDGTTFTFTQQDNNTTYGVATHNANGLMSAADKTKLDSLSTTSVSAITNSEIDAIVAN